MLRFYSFSRLFSIYLSIQQALLLGILLLIFSFPVLAINAKTTAVDTIDNDTEEDDETEDDEIDNDTEEDDETEDDEIDNDTEEEDETENDEIEATDENSKDTEEEETEEDEAEKESSENNPPKLIETSASINFSYGVSQNDEGNEKETDLSGSIDISITPNNNLSFHTSIGKRRETDLEIDEAYVDWAIRDDQTVFLRAGKKFAPFGEFNSAMISSSLPTQLGETDPEAIIEGEVELDDITLQAYFFKGRSSQTDSIGKHELAYGVALNYETDSANIGVGYLSNLAEADFFEGFDDNNVTKKIPAVVLHAEVSSGRFTVIGEHLAATKNFVADDLDETITEEAKPTATQLEVNAELNKKGTLALAWNTTQEAEELDLTKEKLSLAYSHDINEQLTATIEISRSKAYNNDKSKEVIVELSQEF